MQIHGRVVKNQGLTEFGTRWFLGASGIDFSMILGPLLGGLGGLWYVSGTSGLDLDFQGVPRWPQGSQGILVPLKV